MVDSTKLLRNIVITGGNKGIGYGIISGIMQSRAYNVFLTSRTKDLGEAAIKELKSKFPNSKSTLSYYQLDISDKKSIENFIKYFKDSKMKIDCLVNNAGVATKGDTFNLEVLDFTFQVNFYATTYFTEEILKENLINDNGKILIIGSTAGQLKFLKGKSLKEEFRSNDIELDKLTELAKRFRTSVEKDTWEKEGWCRSTYKVSKICINYYAKVLGKRKEILDKGIQCYSCCPGWVRTDMGGEKAHRSLDEGVVTPLYLVDLEHKINKDYQGKFFYDEKLKDFEADIYYLIISKANY